MLHRLHWGVRKGHASSFVCPVVTSNSICLYCIPYVITSNSIWSLLHVICSHPAVYAYTVCHMPTSNSIWFLLHAICSHSAAYTYTVCPHQTAYDLYCMSYAHIQQHMPIPYALCPSHQTAYVSSVCRFSGLSPTVWWALHSKWFPRFLQFICDCVCLFVSALTGKLKMHKRNVM